MALSRSLGRGWQGSRSLVFITVSLSVCLLTGLVGATLLVQRLPPEAAMVQAFAKWRAPLWHGVIIMLVFAAVVQALAALQAPSLRKRLPPATAEGLGATRMWIAAILLASVLWEDLASTAYLPRGMFALHGKWLVKVLQELPIGFDHLLASSSALQIYKGTTALLLILAMVGLFTRWTVPAAALAYLLFASIMRSYSWSYHTGLVPLYALLLLSFTRCGDAWSLDRWRRLRHGLPVAPAQVSQLHYSLGRYLVWMAIALPYTMAGLSKLRNGGPLWWRGDYMQQRLVAALLEPMHFDFEITFQLLRGPGWVFDALGLAALVGEIAFVLVLVSHLARRILPLVMAGMHVGILLLQNILFPDLIAIQAVFYDWTPLRNRLTTWAARSRALRRGPVTYVLTHLPGGPTAVRSAGPRSLRPHETAYALALPADGADGAATAPASPGRRPPTPRPRGIASREAFVARAFLLVGFVCWATRTEKFPFTGMQMFSRSHVPEPVEYVRPLVRYDDGVVERARFERWIGAMADTRYRWLLRDWSSRPERIELLREFLDACARRANVSPAAGRRIRQFELEVRRWDFQRHPADPNRGQLLYVLRHNVDSGERAWTPTRPQS